MIRWTLNIIVLLLLLRLALRFVLGLFQGLADPSPASASRSSSAGRGAAGPARIAGELVKDPACGTYIPRETAIAARVRGETRYYCSVTCRDKDADASGGEPRMGRAAHG
jgi:YHS domain-containing protein